MLAHEFAYFFQYSPGTGELAVEYVTQYRWFFHLGLVTCLRQMHQAQPSGLGE